MIISRLIFSASKSAKLWDVVAAAGVLVTTDRVVNRETGWTAIDFVKK